MSASAVFNAATATNVDVLRSTNALFQLAQKRVSSGKSIFSAADDAPKFIMSDRMHSRVKNLESVNNGISTNLAALGNTEKTLNQIKGILDQMSKNAADAINATASTTISATSTANINESTTVSSFPPRPRRCPPSILNHRLSITSDNGRNFTFTFTNTTTSWGQVARALDDAKIGVTMRFQADGTGGTNVVLESTDSKTGFTIDGASSRQIVGNLVGIKSGYDGDYEASRFVDAALRPTGLGDSPTGMRFGVGGILRTPTFAGSAVNTGSSITFLGADGVARTWSWTAPTGARGAAAVKNIDVVVQEINALNTGIKAELVQTGAANTWQISLRNLKSDSMTVLNGTGAFDSGTAARGPTGNTIGQGLARFNDATSLSPRVEGAPIQGSPNVAKRLELGQIYNNFRNEIVALLDGNVTPQGRNLLRGQDITIFLNEFADNGASTNSGLVIRGSSTTTPAGVTLGLAQDGSTWANIGNIQGSKTQVDAAKSTVLALQAQFGAYTSLVKDRYNLNKEFASGLESLANEIVATDMGEESAKLTALQTQQQFAVQAFTAGTQNAQGLLRLLG